MPNTGVMVPGILAKGMQDGEEVNLLPYFSGGLNSTNKNGKAGVVNFLDGGGAEPLKKNMPANDNSKSSEESMRDGIDTNDLELRLSAIVSIKHGRIIKRMVANTPLASSLPICISSSALCLAAPCRA